MVVKETKGKRVLVTKRDTGVSAIMEKDGGGMVVCTNEDRFNLG